MAKKYYAVKAGRKTGIFTTWADCEKQVKGYGGAIYKSFLTESEAKTFLGLSEANSGSCSGTNKANLEITADVVAYIDGSFDKHLGAVGSGGVIFYEGKTYEFSFGTKDPAYTEFWNVAGELLAAMYVLTWAQKQGAKSCALYYDYMGIEMWATKQWKANNALTQKYAAFTAEMKQSLQITFHKVPAHTGVVYNEKADELAKAGVRKA